MEDVSFEVSTDLTPITTTEIQANFKEVKEWLEKSMEPYTSMVFTESSISDARHTRANLRKISAAIDAQRKTIKREWMRPYETYEAKCKELTGIVDNAVTNIDGQIKEMETAEKMAKRDRLEALFSEQSADIAEYIHFEDIFDSKWLNATFAETDAANAIVAKIEETRDGLDAIRGMGSPFETAMLSEFAKSRNLAKAMAEGKRLEAIQKAEEERRAKEESAKVQTPSEPETPTESVQDAPGEAQTKIPYAVRPAVRPVADEEPAEKLYDYQFTMTGMTKAQMYALKQCLDVNGIEYKAKRIS